jgi:hypothetical protein
LCMEMLADGPSVETILTSVGSNASKASDLDIGNTVAAEGGDEFFQSCFGV